MALENSKRHKILNDLKQEISRGFITEEVTVLGRVFKLKTLNEEEEAWSDQFLQPATAYSILASARVPKLALSIVSIDGLAPDQLFEYPDNWSFEEKEGHEKNAVRKLYWLRTEMMKFLADLDRSTILELWSAYSKLDQRRAEVIKQSPN